MDPKRASTVELFSTKDLQSLVLLSAGSVFATALLSRWDGAAVDWLVRVHRICQAKRTKEVAALMARTLLSDPDRDWLAIADVPATIVQ